MARLNLGKVLVTIEGEHDATRAYDKYCEVTSGGSSYVSKKAVPIGTPITDTAFWQLRASKGADGTDGTDGNDGLDAYQPFKGWYADTTELNSSFGTPLVGDYAYVKGATANDPVAIYHCVTAGTWADSGNTFNPSNNQEFASGEALNTVHIVDGLESSSATDVLSAKQGKVLDQKVAALGPKILQLEDVIIGNVIGFEISKGGHITFDAITLSQDGDSIEFDVKTPVTTWQYDGNDQVGGGYNFTKATNIGIAINRSQYAYRSNDGTWVAANTSSLGGTYINFFNFKVSYESGNILFYVNWTLKKTYTGQKALTISGFGGTYASATDWQGSIKNVKYTHSGTTTDLMDFANLAYDSLCTPIRNEQGGIIKEDDVVDSLDSELSNKPLSAKQGKLLNDAISEIGATVQTFDESVELLDAIATQETQPALYSTRGESATDYVIGSDGKISANSSYKLVALTFDEDMSIWMTSDDKSPFTSMYAISTMKDGTYTSRKRYVAGTTDTLPTEGNPLLLSAGTTLYLNATKSQYESKGYFTFHYLRTSVSLNPALVKSSVGAKDNFCVYSSAVSGTVAERFDIYIAQKKAGYIKYSFIRSYDTTINCNVWRISLAKYCDDEFNEVATLTTAGEWEAAIKISGRSDFMGGVAHGDEVFNNIVFVIDGKPTNVTGITDPMSFDEIRIYEDSNLYDPNDSVTAVAKHTSEHIFNSNGVTINQSILWQASLTLAESYMAMFPVAQAVTTHYCVDKDFTPNAIPSGGFDNLVKPNTKKVCLWGANFFAEFGIEAYTDFVSPPRLLAHNNGGTSYNKCYFYSTTATGGTTVSTGDEWKTTTKFKLVYSPT